MLLATKTLLTETNANIWEVKTISDKSVQMSVTPFLSVHTLHCSWASHNVSCDLSPFTSGHQPELDFLHIYLKLA